MQMAKAVFRGFAAGIDQAHRVKGLPNVYARKGTPQDRGSAIVLAPVVSGKRWVLPVARKAKEVQAGAA